MDQEDMIEVLRPELHDLRGLYTFAALTTSVTLDRYTNGKDLLEVMCQHAGVGSSSV